MANAGGAWDNAKKVVEVDLKQKGTELHAATVVGDTVGVREGFHRADAQIRTAKRMVDSDLTQVVHLRDEGRRVNAGSQLPFLEKLGIDGDVVEVGRHVLHAGHTDRCGMCKRAFHGMTALVVAQRRDHFIDKVGRRVFQSASGIAFRIAHDDSTGRLGVFAVIPASLSASEFAGVMCPS